jgi:phosphoenolpyruvate synthase/pyruvate phosphate dikinase
MTTTQSAIIGLDDPAARQLPLVGGKGANLAELIAAGFPVPGGFCVDTTGRADPGGHRGGGAGRLRPAR